MVGVTKNVLLHLAPSHFQVCLLFPVYLLSGMIVSGCGTVQPLLLRTVSRLVSGRSARLPLHSAPLSAAAVRRRWSTMAASRSPEMPVPGQRSDPVHLASPSAENLLLFSESPTPGWLSCRGLSSSAPDEPAAPSIVLTPAEPPTAAAEEEPSEPSEPPSPPPSRAAAAHGGLPEGHAQGAGHRQGRQ